jgi:hypothetical protein
MWHVLLLLENTQLSYKKNTQFNEILSNNEPDVSIISGASCVSKALSTHLSRCINQVSWRSHCLTFLHFENITPRRSRFFFVQQAHQVLGIVSSSRYLLPTFVHVHFSIIKACVFLSMIALAERLLPPCKKYVAAIVCMTNLDYL